MCLHLNPTAMKKIMLLGYVLLLSMYGLASCDLCLVANYPFAGNANDVSGNGNNGTVSGATLTTDRFGNANSAYSFNGSSDYINIGHSAAMKKYNSDFTIAAWVNPASFSSNYQSMIVSNRGSSGQGAAFALLGALNSGNQGRIASIISGGGSATQVIGTEVLNTGTWYFVVLTFKYNGSNSNDVKLYVNGVLKASSTQKDIADPGLLDTYIGYEPSGSSPVSYHFNGKVDDVKIYNCALSQAQITNMYASENAHLVAYYPFCGDANDASGNGNNGVVYSASLTTDRFGRSNSAYLFDGSSSYIDLGNSAALKKYNADFSVSAWINPASFSTDYQSMIVSNRGYSGEGSAFALLGAYNGADQGKIASIVNGGGSATQVAAPVVLTTGTWSLVTLTFKYNGSNNNTVKLYVNGVLKITATQKDVLDPGALHTFIGFEPSGASPVAYHFNGKIDDVRIYNSVLSDAFILNLYDVNDNIFRVALSADADATYSDNTVRKISIYPNPSSEVVFIESEDAIQKVILLNSEGKVVYTKEIGNLNAAVPLTQFTKGVYILKIQTASETKSEKLIIN